MIYDPALAFSINPIEVKRAGAKAVFPSGFNY